jgi:hypothetical protein
MINPSGGGTGNRFFHAFRPENKNNDQVKLIDDRYDVFVNGTFVGHKRLNTKAESLTDIDDFLKQQGITEFNSKLDRDKYIIVANGKTNQIKDILEVYFNNR